MSLRGKVITFLIFALGALAIVAIGNYYLNSRMQSAEAFGLGIGEALDDMQSAKIAERTFLAEGDSKISEQAIGAMVKAESRLQNLREHASDSVVLQALDSMRTDVAKYRELFSQVSKNVAQINTLQADLMAAGAGIEETARIDVVEFLAQLEGEKLMETGEGLDDMLIEFRNMVKDYAALSNRVILNVQRLFLNNIAQEFKAQTEVISESRKILEENAATFLPNIEVKELPPAWDSILEMSGDIQKAENELFSLWNTNRSMMLELDKQSAKVAKNINELSSQSHEDIKNSSKTANILGPGVSIIAAVLLLFWGLYMIRSTIRPLRIATDALNSVVAQVETSASATQRTSQVLAEGSSQQAAAIEETSASLEEMSSMTQRNAENAGQANSLMTETRSTVGKASNSMEEMSTAMDEISSHGQEISKIIKTIDEIAFQTNLLALNAAVEAARAGEAGQGFAVVADEVRNLAQKAAEAARNTATLIETTVEKINSGNSLVKRTQENFTDVAENANKIADLVQGIAAASSEQADGITQINKAVAQMDQVTQANAAGAAESAEAADELTIEAHKLRDTAHDLTNVVDGTKATSTMTAALPPTTTRPAKEPQRPAVQARDETMIPARKGGMTEVEAESVIPMDKDFDEF